MDLEKRVDSQISESETWDVIEFARNMYNTYPTIFNPDLVNARMKDVTMNPLAAEEDGITRSLADPKNNELPLRGYSEFFEYTNMIYKRTLHYLGNMLAFDIVPICTNASGEDYNSPAYKKDEAKMYDFLDKFDYKNEFTKISRQLLRQDAYFGVFRDDGSKYVFQELPINYSKITGKFEHGLLFDFNMMWFLGQTGVDINMYPPVFKKYLKRVMDGKNNGYAPSKTVDSRTGEWVYWVQTSPEDGMWSFKMNQEQTGQVPYFAPMFPDVVMAPTIRALQKSKYIIEASRILVGIIPMLKDAKSGSVKDMFALSPEAMGKFANLFRQGLSSEIQVAIGPFEAVQSVDFHTTDTNMFEQYNKNLSAQTGLSSRILFSLDKPNALETQASMNVDEMVMTYLYPQFNHFMEFCTSRITKKFKFKFYFEGTNFSSDRTRRQKEALTFAQSGIVLPEKIAASYGVAPQDLKRMMEKAKVTKFDSNCMLLLNQFTQPTGGTASTTGRPQKADSDLTDAGQDTRSSGSNLGKGGSV
jgi:hypothetical protein